MMRWLVVAIASAVLASGCLSYASYSYTWNNATTEEGLDTETVEVLFGIELAVGVAVAIGMIATDEKRGTNWGMDIAAGMLTPFIVDAAVALGVGTSDFVAGAHAPE